MENMDKEYVTKTTSGILVLPADGYHEKVLHINKLHMLNRAKSACIQCSFCSQLCPRALLGHPLRPHKIMRKMAVCTDISLLLDDADIKMAQLCCECGVCEIYACPMDLQPRMVNSMIKRELAAKGIRSDFSEVECVPDDERENRKAPSKRVAGRMGLAAYYDADIKDLISYEADEVKIPLKMTVGAPCVPCVRIGDMVSAGDIIAKVADGKLGAQVHASISGRISAIDDKITITKDKR